MQKGSDLVVSSCRILIADDHQPFRDIAKKILQEKSNIEIVGEAVDAPGLFDMLQTFAPHIVILGLSLPEITNGILTIEQVKKTCPAAKVLVLTLSKECDYLIQTICAGADGCLLKEKVDTELCRAVEMIERGEVYISREFFHADTADTGRMGNSTHD